jgi:uncharacterized protein YndB with AHSA1/START domain
MITEQPQPLQVDSPVVPPGTRSAFGEVAIDASAERVWQALTDARELERWFPLDARVEPGPDGSVWMSWRNEFAATMKIRVWQPPHHLRTAWAFHEGEGTGQVTDYLIESARGSTIVRAVTSGFPTDPSWDGWVEGTNRGWAFELRSLKHYLERHDGESRHVAYLRRRIPLSIPDIWARVFDAPDFAPWLKEDRAFDYRMNGQLAAIVDDPSDALFRVSIEPGAPATDQRELVLWLSAWGGASTRIAEIERHWTDALTRLFPNATIP